MPVAVSKPVVQTIPATADIKEILEILHRDGVIVLSDFCPEEEVDALNAKAKIHFERCEAEGRAADSFHGSKGRATHTTAAYGLLGSAPEELCKIMQRKVWHQVMEEFLTHESWDWGGDEKVYRKTGYWLHTNIGYKVSPGANNQRLHRDLNSAAIQRTGPESLVNGVSTFVAGCDVTPRNGGTHVAPGSHLWPQDRMPTQEDTVAVSMKKGSMAIWLSNIFHGAGANTCEPDEPNAVRTIYGLFCISDNFRQGESTAWICEPEVLKKMPPEVLRLLGMYAGRTGGGRFIGREPVQTWGPLKDYNGGEWIYRGLDSIYQ
ncbi:hypothetical protein IAR55_001352 [Kwoniella newhampshirensis]|uniref:Phytanoyl-CoA dioxygenase n=1 Tax=Kwoniella newhampshirensis TaxID=1651941 RepID=A0AAW0Z5L7_9TREE